MNNSQHFYWVRTNVLGKSEARKFNSDHRPGWNECLENSREIEINLEIGKASGWKAKHQYYSLQFYMKVYELTM